EVPDAGELPRMLRAVVPLVGRQRRPGRVVRELVALTLRHHELAGLRVQARVLDPILARRARLLPCLAAVVRALDDLTAPARRLRRVDAVRIDRRALHVKDLPAGEEGSRNGPVVALAVRRQDESPFSSADQDSYCRHCTLSFVCLRVGSGADIEGGTSPAVP